MLIAVIPRESRRQRPLEVDRKGEQQRYDWQEVDHGHSDRNNQEDASDAEAVFDVAGVIRRYR